MKKHAGESAPIQRCQVHKRRNVLDHLTDEQKPAVAKKLNAAYALEDYAAAKQALNMLHRELMDLNPSAARSLGEGMEETLTVHRLHVPPQLRKTLASTNVIESAFSIVEQVCKNVKRWHGGDQRERWVGSGLLVAQKQFRRVTGLQTDSGAHQRTGSAGAAQARSCQAEKGVVKWVTREPLLSTELRAFPQVRFGSASLVESVRFGGADGLDLQQGLQTVLDSVKQRADALEGVRQLYSTGPVSLHMYGDRFDRNAYTSLVDIALEEGQQLKCNFGTSEEREQALDALKTAKAIVVDITVLATLRLLDLTKVLSSQKFKFIIFPGHPAHTSRDVD